jgi:hypothetical protein
MSYSRSLFAIDIDIDIDIVSNNNYRRSELNKVK